MLNSGVFFILLHLTFVYGDDFENITLTEFSIKEENYPYEKHTIQTTDEYLLTSYRIEPTSNKTGHNGKLPPVVLMHGMMSASEDYVLIGRDSLAFMMADAGYDVWLLNARPSESSAHLRYSKEDDEFWNFSWDEMAKYDVAESIDHVLKTTGAEKVIYIGYSYGNPLYIMMLNERPDLIDKIAISVALSPAYFNGYYKSYAEVFYRIIQLEPFQSIVFGEKNYYQSNGDWKSRRVMRVDKSKLENEYAFRFLLYGSDWKQISWKNTDKVLGRMQLCSLKQVGHYLQILKDGVLEKFDYGREINIQKYGTEMAPLYSWKVSKAPMVLYFGKNDRPVTQDLEKIVGILKATGSKFKVRIPTWEYFNHLDFVTSRTVTKELNEDLLDVLSKMLKKK